LVERSSSRRGWFMVSKCIGVLATRHVKP
jgi:hypothetical protein